MTPSIRLLIAEDSEPDADLEIRELKRAGLRIAPRVVASRDAFVQALRAFGPDVILSDFSMPGFDGMEALRLSRELVPEIPFIFVSGTLGEDYAIRALKNGASDYVVKGNLVRLPAAVERAIAEAEVERQRRRLQTELEVARERLQLSEAGLRRAQSMARLAHLVTGPGGAFESWSETLPDLIGEDPAQTGRSVRSWMKRMDAADREAFRGTVLEAGRTGRRAEIDFRLERAGQRVHLRQVIEPLGDSPSGLRWFSTLQDVTEQKHAEERIRRLNRVYAVLSGINGLIVRASSRDELFGEACRIAVESGQLRMAWLGTCGAARQTITPAAWAGHEAGFLELMALSLGDAAPEGRGLVRRTLREKRAVIINDMAGDTKFRLRREALERGFRSGAVLPLAVGGEIVGMLGLFAGEAHFFDDDEMRLLTELAGDIAFAVEHIEKSERLDYLAYFDGLTGLANRALFLQRLEQALATALAAGGRLAVFLMDIDRFRPINDALGRQAGDKLLKDVAGRILQVHAGGANVGRLGADHFAVFRANVESEEQIARLVEQRLAELFDAPYRVGDSEMRVSARVGIALAPDDGGHADVLLQKAEAALKRAKAQGEAYVFHAAAMTERTAENLALETRLRRALERREFVLHYQPKVELATRRIAGVEALIRWQSPELGLVPPMKFIPLLEETGLILDVGAWALQRAAADHRRWVDKGLRAPRVAVNVSAIQLRHRHFVATVEQALMEGVAPVALDLELTETLVMQDIEANTAKLKSVRALGMEVAIDDFGTGYSSLAYLARLPVQILKVDRAFIRGMLDDADTAILVRTIVGLAHSLRLKVVAEGVETEAQATALRELGCDQMQGFLFSRPVPCEELEALLR